MANAGENGAVSKQTLHLLRSTDSAENDSRSWSRFSPPRCMPLPRHERMAFSGFIKARERPWREKKRRTRGSRTKNRKQNNEIEGKRWTSAPSSSTLSPDQGVENWDTTDRERTKEDEQTGKDKQEKKAKEKQEERGSKRKTEVEGRVTSTRKNVATSSSRPSKSFFFSSRFVI